MTNQPPTKMLPRADPSTRKVCFETTIHENGETARALHQGNTADQAIIHRTEQRAPLERKTPPPSWRTGTGSH